MLGAGGVVGAAAIDRGGVAMSRATVSVYSGFEGHSEPGTGSGSPVRTDLPSASTCGAHGGEGEMRQTETGNGVDGASRGGTYPPPSPGHHARIPCWRYHARMVMVISDIYLDSRDLILG